MILAVDKKNGLGKNWKLPWYIKEDMMYFKDMTTRTKDPSKKNAVIMWRKTWESIPPRFKPLSNRINCILSREVKLESNNGNTNNLVLYFNSFENCLEKLDNREDLENIFIIWWAYLYNQVLNNPLLEKIYITRIKWDFKCDKFFDWIPDNFVSEWEWTELKEKKIKFYFEVYSKK